MASELCWLQGDAFVVKVLARDYDKPCYNGRFVVLILVVKRNGEQLKNRDREKLDRKAKRNIWLCLLDSIFLNVSGEDITRNYGIS